MALDLSPFGWAGLSLSLDLHDLVRSLPTWRHLNILQDADSTSLRFPNAPFTGPDVSGTGAGQGSYIPGYTKGALINSKGTYSNIYKGRRTLYTCKSLIGDRLDVSLSVAPHDIAIKEVYLNITKEEDAASPRTKHDAYEDEISAILYEAVIHVLVYKSLDRVGLSRYTPKMHEIVAEGFPPHNSPTHITAIWFCMELLNGSTMDDYLRKHLVKSTTTTIRVKNEAILTDFLIQCAVVLHHLQTNLRFHHRDLKLNNVYQRDARTEHRAALVLPNGHTWIPTLDLVLLDYGFSCIACGSLSRRPRSTLLGAGSWFTMDDDCCKEGRDLAQLIFSLHCHFPLQEYIGPEFLAFFTKVMTATDHGRPIPILHGFTVDGYPLTGGQAVLYHNGIYHFLKRNSVEIPLCKPSVFLDELCTVRHI
jgi:serine/threonine protein kinase